MAFACCSTIPSFDLGRDDLCLELVVPATLFGRTRELAALLSAFERARGGGAELVLIAGPSGIGKSALGRELAAEVIRARGWIAEGKFEQRSCDVPYAALIQAARQLIRLLLAQSDSVLSAWRERLLQVLGAHAAVVAAVIPDAVLVIGEQPAPPPLGAKESRNRLVLAFGAFLRLLADAEHPLVLFLDDLQWADAGSLELIRSVLMHPQSGHLLLVGAYRADEVEQAHPLHAALARWRESVRSCSELSLMPLTSEDLAEMVAATLRSTATEALPLGRELHRKSGGNPLFARQLLESLRDDGLIQFSAEAGRWIWELDRIDLGVADDGVERLLDRMRRLPTPTQMLMSRAACIGSRFDLQTLAAVCHADLAALGEHLRLARAG